MTINWALPYKISNGTGTYYLVCYKKNSRWFAYYKSRYESIYKRYIAISKKSEEDAKRQLYLLLENKDDKGKTNKENDLYNTPGKTEKNTGSISKFINCDYTNKINDK